MLVAPSVEAVFEKEVSLLCGGSSFLGSSSSFDYKIPGESRQASVKFFNHSAIAARVSILLGRTAPGATWIVEGEIPNSPIAFGILGESHRDVPGYARITNKSHTLYLRETHPVSLPTQTLSGAVMLKIDPTQLDSGVVDEAKTALDLLLTLKLGEDPFSNGRRLLLCR